MAERRMIARIRVEKGLTKATLRVYNPPHGTFNASEASKIVHLENLKAMADRGLIEHNKARLDHINRKSLENLEKRLEREHPRKRFDFEYNNIEYLNLSGEQVKDYKERFVWGHKFIREIKGE